MIKIKWNLSLIFQLSNEVVKLKWQTFCSVYIKCQEISVLKHSWKTRRQQNILQQAANVSQPNTIS